MASQYFGLNRGVSDEPDEVTTGTSTGSTDVELRVDLTKSLTKKDVTLIVSALLRHINDGRVVTIANV